jgi:hypothetical protein
MAISCTLALASSLNGTNLALKMFRTWPVAMEVRHVACRVGEASQQFHTQMRQSSDPETSRVPVEFQEMVFTHLHTMGGSVRTGRSAVNDWGPGTDWWCGALRTRHAR